MFYMYQAYIGNTQVEVKWIKQDPCKNGLKYFHLNGDMVYN